MIVKHLLKNNVSAKERQTCSAEISVVQGCALCDRYSTTIAAFLKPALQVSLRKDAASPLVDATAEQQPGTPRWTPRVDPKIGSGASRKTLVQNLVAYAIAAAIVCYAARGVSLTQVVDATRHATLWIFVIAS